MGGGGLTFVLQRESELQNQAINPTLAGRDVILRKLTIRPANLPAHRFGVELTG